MKLFHRYIYDMKLKYKLLLSYLLLILIPMVVIFAYFQLRFVYRLEKNTLDMEEVIVEQIAGNVESYMNQIAEAADMAAQSETLRKLLTCTEEKLSKALSSQRDRDAMTTYLENVRSQVDGEMITGIRIYCEPEHPLFREEILMDYGIFESREKIDTSLWYGLFQNEDSPTELVASSFYMNSWEGDTMGWISYIKKIQYFELGEKREAYAAVYFNKEYLSEVLKGYGSYPHSCIYLIDEKESIVAMEGQDEMSQYILDYQDVARLIDREKTFQKIDYGDRDAWTLYRDIGQTGWKLVFTLSEEAVTGAVRLDSFVFMGVYAAVAAVMCLLVLLLSRSITGRITVLKDEMQKVKNSPPKAVKAAGHKDEIGELAESYNYMAETINRLLTERIRIVKDNNRMEMNVLRAQINPHFLYNTLDMISWYAKRGEAEEATSSIQALARFYKLSLNQGELLTTVENELRLLEQYIDLQKRRILGEIELIVDVPEEMLEKKIPQFLLQPIVENSLKHGILEKEEPEGYIMVTGWLEEKEMVLVIADDGIGMEPALAETILSRKRDEGRGEREGHIGVQNIYRRLSLFYGKDGFSMKYQSSPGEGTQVELRLSYEMRREAFLDG